MNNEIKINVPEGMEIDKENSTFECIKFKPKWIPKRGDIAVAGSYMPQIILIGEYIEKSNIIGFDIMCLAVLNTSSNHLTIWEQDEQPLWVEREASATEKALFIKKLNEQGYVYNQNDPRIIYKKEKELPKTWEEFCRNNPIKDGEVFINSASNIQKMLNSYRDCVKDDNLLPSEEYAKAMLALCKLIQLRDCYNDGWKPDWNGDSKYYCIFYNKGNIELFVRNTWSCVLAFKSRELRDEFYNNFKNLIKQAKLLL
jgi:hypothetical protein